MEPERILQRQSDMTSHAAHPLRRSQIPPPQYPTSRMAPQAVIKVPARRKRGPSPILIITITVIIGVVAVVGLVLAGIFGFYGYYQATGRIVPGVRVGSTQLGSMTLSEASVSLHKTWNLEKQILATNGAQSQVYTPDDLGISIDAVQTAQKANNVAHGGSLLSETAQMFASMKDGWEIEPVIAVDEAKARAAIEGLTPLMSLLPVDATLRIEGTELIPVPGELGYTVNIEETLQTLLADPRSILLNGRLQVIPQPAKPRVEDVTPAIAEAQRLLDSQVSIYGYDPIKNEHLNWPVPRQEIASWLIVVPGEDGPHIALDAEQVTAYLSGLSGELGPGRYLDAEEFGGPLAEAVRQGTPLPVTINYQPTKYVVQPGDTMLKLGWRLGMPYWMITQANPGINPENLLTGTELTIPAKTDLLPLPIVPNKRIILSISKQRLWVYQDGRLLGTHVISTGIDKSPTQPGIFQVQTHDKNAYASVWDLYMPNFLGIYEAWPGFMNGLHGLPTLSNGQRLWANILGRPASYGCIILDLDTSRWLYDWAEDGVVVEIQG